VWGLVVDGEQGVGDVLSLLRDELDLAMALTGCRSIDEITSDLLSPQ
jgi:isopentenyl diphosphate isomerase/L-lactate dehydrogenase-like FMN-dependent dehydrogenase